ncbi:metalloendoproteinase 5-MMP-like [Telopea speciosissima]|uniref:metalloendoproteinase 5-MMP-like n=1 Tax=Telopea speciosissima TaxID=54955 RepID=UPI001CC68242|nr:metalloendoproteinase 5-MMP-like [Telopea speciosissima]
MKSLHTRGSLLSAITAISLVHLCLLSTYIAGHRILYDQNNNNKPSNSWDSFHNFTGHQKGDNVDGLSNLKQYLHQFGYISSPSNSSSNSSSNFTNTFDDTLESALKRYQKNFNLNSTGQLDNTTVQLMARPRCGNADIVNGTSTMNSGKPSHSNLHTVAHYSFFENTPTWPENKRNLTYGFWPGNQLQDNAKVVFSRAFQRWAAVTPLTFTETDSFLAADIKIGFFGGDHGDGESFDGSMGTLAHAFSPTAGLFHLDSAEDWVIDGDVTTSTSTVAIDMESVAVHEIGHVLGLGHSSVEEAIMYPSISARTRKTELATDDIQGIQELYGSNPNYNASSTPSDTQKETSDGGVRIMDWHWTLTMIISTVASVGLLL